MEEKQICQKAKTHGHLHVHLLAYLSNDVRCCSSCGIRLLSRALSRLLGLLQLLDELALFLGPVLQYTAPATQLLQLPAVVGNTLLELRAFSTGKRVKEIAMAVKRRGMQKDHAITKIGIKQHTENEGSVGEMQLK